MRHRGHSRQKSGFRRRAPAKQLLESARAVIGKGHRGIDEFIETDKAVHLCIAKIADNPLFTQALEAALGLKRYFCRFQRLHPSFMNSNLNDLKEIVQAIENRQANIACFKTRHHIAVFNASIP